MSEEEPERPLDVGDLLSEYTFGKEDTFDDLGFNGWTDDDIFNMQEDAPDPAAQAEQDIGDIARGFRERAAREEERLNTWVVSGHYLVVVFATAAQASAFLAQSEWGDEHTVYVDGAMLADRLGYTLPETPDWRAPRIDKDYAARALRSAVLEEEHRKE